MNGDELNETGSPIVLPEESAYTIGADEVGYGAFAGPLVVCAVLAPSDWRIKGLNDSKKLSHKRRSSMYDAIQEQAPFIQWFIDWTPPEEVDRLGVGRARKLAFRHVLTQALAVRPDASVIVDGDMDFADLPVVSLPKADGLIPSVMAASILAKVERDRWMHTEADSLYPEYGFINHVGYGTAAHLKALDAYGPCPIHRLSYEPVARRVKGVRTLSVNSNDAQSSLPGDGVPKLLNDDDPLF